MSYDMPIEGTEWKYYKKEASNGTFSISITSDKAFDLYIMKGTK
jgi:hypothetical protein